MNISVELTFSPLQDNFEPPVIDFIKKLRASGFTVLENPLSTQIYGEAVSLMKFLNAAILEALGGVDHGLFQIKIVKSDRSAYEPNY